MLCVPKSLGPPCSVPIPHRLFTCKHPTLFNVQLARLTGRTHDWDPGTQGSWCQALLLPQANPFTALCLCHPAKLGGIYSIFTQTTAFMGQNYCIRAGHHSAASHLQHSHLANSRKPNTLQKLFLGHHPIITKNLEPLKLSPPCTLWECYLLIRALFTNNLWF